MDELRSDDPQWIGAYRLLGRLGTGGMGRVFLARSPRGRTVAVKLVRGELAAQEEFRTRFRREVQAARRVGGKWTAPVLDADTEAEIPWVATGYVAGPSLQQVVGKDYGPLPERSVRVLAAGLAHALSDIHAAGLVHRDLKPSNVMITIDGPRVIDFGIARALETVADGSLTYTGAMVGSPAFMSPEQVRGDRVTPACDVFCLGSVLAYAATGLQPFGAASSGVHAQMFRIVQEPPDLDAVPEGLRELVAACLVKEPGLRPSLSDVLARIGAVDDGQDPAADSGTTGAGATGDRAEPWLPGGIVAQLGRHAVQLLELEAEATVPGVPPLGPEPVTEVVPPVVAQPAVAAPVVPPPVVAAPAAPPAPPPATPVSTAAVSAAAPPPPPTGRGRRGALVAVLALLAVIAGGTTAFVVVQQGKHNGTTAGPTTSPTPTSAAPMTQAAPTPTPTPTATTTPPQTTPPETTPPATTPPQTTAPGVDIPPDLIGTWQSTFTTADGDNTRTLTIHQDGSVVLTGESMVYNCVWSMSVTSAGPPLRLGPSLVVSGVPASSCNSGAATTLTVIDASHLRRDNLEGGKAPLTYEKVD